RISPIAKFVIVTVTSWFVGLGAYASALNLGVRWRVRLVIAYPFGILMTAMFHLRYVRTQREFIVNKHPWADFFIISLVEWMTCGFVAAFAVKRVPDITLTELFILSFGCATIVRYVLRKEFMQDIRGLRR